MRFPPADGATPGNGASGHPVVAQRRRLCGVLLPSREIWRIHGAGNPTGAQEIFEQVECLGVAGCTPGDQPGSNARWCHARDRSKYRAEHVPGGSLRGMLLQRPGTWAPPYRRSTTDFRARHLHRRDDSDSPRPARLDDDLGFQFLRRLSSPLRRHAATWHERESERQSVCDDRGDDLHRRTIDCLRVERATNLGSNVQNGIENDFRPQHLPRALPTTTTACTPRVALASQPAGVSPAPANGSSKAPSISADGHAVGFLSAATNLVTGDNNGLVDAFLGATSF